MRIKGQAIGQSGITFDVGWMAEARASESFMDSVGYMLSSGEISPEEFYFLTTGEEINYGFIGSSYTLAWEQAWEEEYSKYIL